MLFFQKIQTFFFLPADQPHFLGQNWCKPNNWLQPKVSKATWVITEKQSKHCFWKKITHMWRWDTPQNFLLAFIVELWKTKKIRILRTWKKKLEISSFYSCVPKTRIIWARVPEIQSETNVFGHFGSFFTPNNPENQNFEKMKKASGDVMILNLCNKKQDQMVYAILWAIFCPLTILTTQKVKILKK